MRCCRVSRKATTQGIFCDLTTKAAAQTHIYGADVPADGLEYVTCTTQSSIAAVSPRTVDRLVPYAGLARENALELWDILNFVARRFPSYSPYRPTHPIQAYLFHLHLCCNSIKEEF